MSIRFAKLMRQALKTFACNQQEVFFGNLVELKQMVDQLSYRDLYLNPQILFKEAAFAKVNRPPCRVIKIFENDTVSMSVFMMRGNYTMPLHDHPMMYGMLRGLHGKMRLLAYTQQFEEGEEYTYSNDPGVVTTIAEHPIELALEKGCSLLTPDQRNFHQIKAEDGPAAFFSVLGPPYEADMPVYGKRECRYYRQVPPPPLAKNETGNEVYLQHVPRPRSFSFDFAEPPDMLIKAVVKCSTEAESTSSPSQPQRAPYESPMKARVNP